jgi:hypothetical protein
VRLDESDDAAFGHWLAGLIDGEGSFGIYSSNGHRGRADWRFVFSINLRADDAALLQAVHKRMGIGRIYRAPNHRERQHPTVIWRIDSASEHETLVRFIDTYPLWSKKRRDYSIWREALLARGDRARVRSLQKRLSQTRRYEAPSGSAEPLPPALFDV